MRGFAALIDNHLRFDYAFFGAKEAEVPYVDPQQRLLWEMRGSRVGLYVGVMAQDYRDIAFQVAASTPLGVHMTGGYLGAISGRLSHQLGFAGPSVTLDTACSSSLVAVHLAARARQNGECDLAVSRRCQRDYGPVHSRWHGLDEGLFGTWPVRYL